MEETITVRLPYPMARALRQEAYSMMIDMSAAVRLALKDWLPDNYATRPSYVALEEADKAIKAARTDEERRAAEEAKQKVYDRTHPAWMPRGMD
jgi:hypothetical protein